MTTSIDAPKSTVHTIATLIGSTVLLIGIYCGARIGINTILFDRYPTTGVLQIASYPMYGQREEDCSFTTPYYSFDGKPRTATEAEAKIESEQANRCLSSVQETRKVAFIQDIATTAFFLFIGTGILIVNRLTKR